MRYTSRGVDSGLTLVASHEEPTVHDGDLLTRFLLAIPMVTLLWLCVWLSGKFNNWLGLGGKLQKPEKVPLSAQVIKVLKVLISLTLAMVAAMAGVFAVALGKAIIPIFHFTAGTRFELYVQDPILYTLGPLYFGYMAFKGVMSKLNQR
jgi:hypothetical protein